MSRGKDEDGDSCCDAHVYGIQIKLCTRLEGKFAKLVRMAALANNRRQPHLALALPPNFCAPPPHLGHSVSGANGARNLRTMPPWRLHHSEHGTFRCFRKNAARCMPTTDVAGYVGATPLALTDGRSGRLFFLH